MSIDLASLGTLPASPARGGAKDGEASRVDSWITARPT